VAGVDISYDCNQCETAYCTIVVLVKEDETWSLKYEKTSKVKITNPYLTGFLSFREIEFFENSLNDVRQRHPELYPQVVFVDGNGLYHPRRCGLASHLGVISNTPTIGISKSYLYIPKDGIDTEYLLKIKRNMKEFKGATYDVTTSTGEVLAKALITSDKSKKPVFVSVGHKVTLQFATELTLEVSNHRVPEPIRLADIISRRECQHFSQTIG